MSPPWYITLMWVCVSIRKGRWKQKISMASDKWSSQHVPTIFEFSIELFICHPPKLVVWIMFFKCPSQSSLSKRQMRLGKEYQVNFFWAQQISSLLHSLVGLLCSFLWGWKRLIAISYWFFEISLYLIQHSLKQRHLRTEKVWFKKIQVCLINIVFPDT